MRVSKKKVIIVLIIITLIVVSRLLGVDTYLSLEQLQHNALKLKDFVSENYVTSGVSYIVMYIVSVALSIPGATILTLAGGFLFGTIIGAAYVNIGATVGATFIFLFSRYLFGDSLQKKYVDKLAAFNREIDTNGYSYLLTLRFIPLFPFFLINICAGLTRVPLWTFVWTTSIGIFPGSLVYAFAGSRLNYISSVQDIFSPKVLIAFVALGCFALMPTIIKRFRQKSEGDK